VNHPDDLVFTSFRDPEFVERYKAFIESAVEIFSARIQYITLHTEGAGTHFVTHPERLEDFCFLLSETMAHIKSVSPGVLVSTYNTAAQTDEMIECMNRSSDYIAVAFGGSPLPWDQHIGDFEGHIDRMERLANGRPIAIMEAAWPSSTGIFSSEGMRAQFVREIIRVLEDRESLYLTYYTVYDENRLITWAWVTAAFWNWPVWLQYILVEWAASLGLITTEEVPKTAWYTLIHGWCSIDNIPELELLSPQPGTPGLTTGGSSTVRFLTRK
jgi:hypothetical protein